MILHTLELRKYKNNFASVENMLVLKLPRFFPYRVGERKGAAISKLPCFSQKRVRSYIALALVIMEYMLPLSNQIDR